MTDVLQRVSEALAATVVAASPGIIRVEARQRLPASGIVWSHDGVILTAHHVVEQDDNIRVGLHDGQTTTATLVGRDPTTDLAVLRATTTDLAPPAWAEPDLSNLRVGHLVLALGRPAQTVPATLGIVSALGQRWRTPGGGLLDRYVQTDVVMYHGFSGGPLVNATGQVVGLNTSTLRRGLSLTVPVSTLRRVVAMLLVYGRLPATLGQHLGQETGLLLIAVEPNSPAEQAGLLLGDTLVALDGAPIRHPDDLLACMRAERIGATVPVRIIRGGQVQERQVVIGKRA